MKKIRDTKFVTDLEKEVIENIISSEYMDADDEKMINWGVWSFTVTNETKRLAGALGSLVKKGLCFVEDEDSDPACGLTEQGYYWAKNNELCK